MLLNLEWGGMIFDLTKQAEPIVWLQPFPVNIQSRWVSDVNPRGDITNSDAELCGVIGGHDVCAQDMFSHIQAELVKAGSSNRIKVDRSTRDKLRNWKWLVADITTWPTSISKVVPLDIYLHGHPHFEGPCYRRRVITVSSNIAVPHVKILCTNVVPSNYPTQFRV